jgi:phosphatidylinositol alpha-mannosyltransferase
VRRLAILSPYALSAPGGVQEQALAMSREWSRRGVEVLLVAPDAADHADHATPARVLTVGRRLDVPANGSRAPLTLSLRAGRRAAQAVAQFAPDVTHLHEPFAPLLAWATLRAHAAPQVATFHRAGGGPAVSLTTPLTRRLARHLDAAVAVSVPAAATLAAAAGISAEVLFNGLETERLREFPRERSTRPTILFLGRLEERKGAVVALRALRAHNEMAPQPWRLVVAGDGPQRAALEREAGIDPRVEFLGALDDAEKRRWLRRADVVVAPSLRGESFGLVLLEAMAAETPLVASDIEGYREAAGGHCALVPPGDPAALARAISETLAGAGAQRVAGARAHAEAWSMSALCDRYAEVYARAGERRAGAR